LKRPKAADKVNFADSAGPQRDTKPVPGFYHPALRGSSEFDENFEKQNLRWCGGSADFV
jgi:hypothetical protein